MMDKPITKGSPAWRRLRRHLLTGFLVVAVVLGVAALPPLFLYVSARLDGSGAPPGPVRPVSATSWGDPITAKAREILSRKASVVALTNVNVVPMDREVVLPGQTVIVRDGRIEAVGPAAQIKIPRQAQRIDASGKYLIPGLADMHAHLRFRESETVAMLQLFVANGVTTILNLYGTPSHLDLRRRIQRDEVLGPALFSSGPFVSDAPREMPTPEEAESAVVEQKRAGYDVLKIHGDFTREAYRRLFAAARREGMRVVGHSPRNLGWEAMVEERQDVVAHAEEYLYDREGSSRHFGDVETQIPQIARATAQAGTWLIPNLVAYKGIGDQANNIQAALGRREVRYVPPSIAEGWQPANNSYVQRFGSRNYSGFVARYHVLEKLTKGFHDAGVRLLTGTDTAIPCVVPGFSAHEELKLLVAAGLTPYQALRAATANPGEFFAAAGKFGTITAGARADLVLLDANPLENIENTTHIVGVLLRGRWIPAADLHGLLAELEASYTSTAAP